jgi:signal transduction histidine kinase
MHSCSAGHTEAFTETLRTGLPVSSCQEMRLRTRDGRWIWFKNSFTHCGSRWHAVLRDLSEPKNVEASLRNFLATTSHDARTPLSSIEVATTLLQERAPLLQEEALELLRAISASTKVLLLLTNNVLLAKKLDAGVACTCLTSAVFDVGCFMC